VSCQAEDGIRYATVTGVQTCALPISEVARRGHSADTRIADPEDADDLGTHPEATPGWPASLVLARSRAGHPPLVAGAGNPADTRSEERRVGEEGRGRGRERQRSSDRR